MRWCVRSLCGGRPDSWATQTGAGKHCAFAKVVVGLVGTPHNLRDLVASRVYVTVTIGAAEHQNREARASRYVLILCSCAISLPDLQTHAFVFRSSEPLAFLYPAGLPYHPEKPVIR